MPTPSRARYRSPDPLLLGPDDDDIGEVKTHSPLKKSARTPTQTTSTPVKKTSTSRKLVVELSLARKRRPSPSPEAEYDEDEIVPLFPAKRHRTPLVRHQRPANGGTPTPIRKPPPQKASNPNTPSKSTPRTPASAQKATSIPRSVPKAKPPATSHTKSKPTPPSKPTNPAKRPRLSTSASALELDEQSPSSISAVSRETFLANEALKRQREARNFVFKGDADAPTLTRSGRVISKAQEDDDEDVEGDEYGRVPDESVAEVDDGVTFLRRDDLHVTLPVAREKQTPKLVSLPEGAQPHVLEILSTLNSRDIATDPPPFVDEEKNEALQGLLNLLKGTVERGEGNSALILGARGVGKTRTVTRALSLLPSTSKTTPIIVRLSGHGQPNDRLAIREMGRQIAEAEGHKIVHEDGDGEEATEEEGEFAPTTLPSHLLALLTAPSPRSIIIIIEEFDLFTEHARQALLYCLRPLPLTSELLSRLTQAVDVVQSIKTGPVETTGRGVAVIGLTSRVDSLLLLEKRVKSRFSHRMWRVASPLAPEGMGWKELMRKTLIPWDGQESATEKEDKAVRTWKDDWQFAIETLLEHDKIGRYLDRLTGLSTDVRNLYRPFIKPMSEILCGTLDFLSIPDLTTSILNQLELSGWGLQQTKLKGLPHPALGVLIIAKHLAFAGREEFGFAMVEEEYLRFARTKLVGSGKVRWPIGVLRTAFDHLLRLSLLVPISNTTVKPQFAKVRCTLAPHETVAFFKADGGAGMGPEMNSWGRLMGGHA